MLDERAPEIPPTSVQHTAHITKGGETRQGLPSPETARRPPFCTGSCVQEVLRRPLPEVVHLPWLMYARQLSSYV